MARKAKSQKKQKSKPSHDEFTPLHPNNENEVPPPLGKSPAQIALQKDLANEQQKLAADLDDYIAEFSRKAAALKNPPAGEELVVLFIMNLHPRWKRLVEPLEPTLIQWEQAAQLAKYHSMKVCAILGVEYSSNTLFTSKQSRQLLTSGYFVPENHPSRTRQATRPSTVSNTSTTSHELKESSHSGPLKAQSSLVASVSSKSPSIPAVKPVVSSTIAAPESPSTNTKPKESTSAKPKTSTSSKPLSTSNTPGKKLNTLQPVPDTITTEELESVERILNHSKYSICHHIPEEHHKKRLPFLELTIAGHKVRAFLAKRHWRKSAMSVSLQHKLNLWFDLSERSVVPTEFGNVMESMGTMLLPITHPADAGLEKVVSIQVLPKIYGGRLDLVLGSDFFVLCAASFTDPEKNEITFMGKKAKFVVDVLE